MPAVCLFCCRQEYAKLMDVKVFRCVYWLVSYDKKDNMDSRALSISFYTFYKQLYGGLFTS